MSRFYFFLDEETGEVFEVMDSRDSCNPYEPNAKCGGCGSCLIDQAFHTGAPFIGLFNFGVDDREATIEEAVELMRPLHRRWNANRTVTGESVMDAMGGPVVVTLSRRPLARIRQKRIDKAIREAEEAFDGT